MHAVKVDREEAYCTTDEGNETMYKGGGRRYDDRLGEVEFGKSFRVDAEVRM